MAIDFRNVNTLWASVLVETLARLGLRTAVICPGSRSAPLAIAFAQHPEIHALSILDERSAAFFALGHSQRTQLATAIVCTSGTAGANFYPAIIEAHESHVPLIALTADRPPELRDCRAGQTIDQLKLYGHFPNWQAELSLPDTERLSYLRQTIKSAWERTLWPVPGPVHLNCPFQDPLYPVEDSEVQVIANGWDEHEFFQSVQPIEVSIPKLLSDQLPVQAWQNCDRGLIIAGPSQPKDPKVYCEAIAQISRSLGWPVLAEGLSPLRNYAELNPHLIGGYAIALKNENLAAKLAPEQVIRIGPLPTSKELRLWLGQVQPCEWVIEGSDRNVDPIHGHCTHLRIGVESLAELLRGEMQLIQSTSEYLNDWLETEHKLQEAIGVTFAEADDLWESKVSWLLARNLPKDTPVFISNSMPVRDVEWFWPKGNSHIRPYFNRGANGIDGIVSSAIGMAFGQQPSVLLTGDLAFLHDVNGLLPNRSWWGHLTIVVINNDGGGIFEMLPISGYEPPFEDYFATPQRVSIAKVCSAYRIEYEAIASWESLIQKLNPLPKAGVRVLEVRCDRKSDTQKRKTIFSSLI